MKKLILIITLIGTIFIGGCTCVSYDNPNSYLGSKVLDTIPVFNIVNGQKTDVWYYKYKINFVGEDGESVYLRTVNFKKENHYFVPGDTISFENEFVKTPKVKKEVKSNNNFIE